jgi:hypothetical protein
MGIPRGFFRPVDYSRRTRYRRPPTAYLRAQWLGPLVQVRHAGQHYPVFRVVAHGAVAPPA